MSRVSDAIADSDRDVSRDSPPGESHGSPSSHGETDSLLRELLRQLAPGYADLPWSAAALQAHTRFQIGPQLGKGGMGIVFQAHDTVLQRDVALKLLRECEPVTVARFLREARAQARVEHENVCRVYDVGELAGVPYIAMQLVHGETLDRLVAQTSIAVRVRVMKQVADGVHAMHRLGLIHRDLKPQNILVELTARGEPWPYVADFGLAREVAGSHTLTLTGQALGTPAYMSPEQARCEDVDRRADVYSLGATLHHLLVGKPPFSGATPGEVLTRVLERPPDPVRRHNHRIPADLEAIVMCCLEKQPQHRYASAHELAQDLQRYLDGEPLWVRRPSLASACRRAIRRHPIVSSIVASSTLAPIVTIVGLHLLARRELNARVSQLVAQAACGARSEANRGFGEAGQSLEAAAAVDPGRADVRAVFGDLLLSRVLLAEQHHRTAERDDVVRRLALHGKSGKRLGSLHQPTHLSIEIVPPTALRTIERYVEDARNSVRLEPGGPASQSSLDDLELPPGSYLLTLSGEGLAAVHYPVVLGRGESVRVSVARPRPAAIPGRFLFETAVEETYRSILVAPPLHAERSDGYLISKREVTAVELVE